MGVCLETGGQCAYVRYRTDSLSLLRISYLTAFLQQIVEKVKRVGMAGLIGDAIYVFPFFT